MILSTVLDSRRYSKHASELGSCVSRVNQADVSDRDRYDGSENIQRASALNHAELESQITIPN